MSIHCMKIRPHFLERIRQGIKTNEYRLADPERESYNIGDNLVLISNQDENQYVKTVIIEKNIYKSWEDALVGRWEDDFKGFESIEDVLKECRRFYTSQEVAKYGIIVYKIKKFNPIVKNSRILFDTNIIIQRESDTDVSFEVAQLQKWIDKLNVVKIFHPITKEELSKYSNETIKNNLLKKIESYEELVPCTIYDDFFESVINKYSKNENSINDNSLLLQVYSGNVDFFITDDKGLLNKAKDLFLDDSVYSSIDFLNLVTEMFPKLVEYDVLSVKMKKFGELNVNDAFFDSLREDYDGIKFNKWFIKKNAENSYVFEDKKGLQGFLYLKIETEDENYKDINPVLLPKKRLKVGTFKVNSTGLRLGERFLKIIFDNAKRNKVDEIYVTLFENKRPEVLRLRDLMIEWGFYKHGIKNSNGESVYVKNMKEYDISKSPKYNYPNINSSCKYGFIPIDAKYHTALFPDLFLKNENMYLYKEKPCSYAIEKIYVTNWNKLEYNPGDILLIYRNGQYWPKKFSSVVSGSAIVQEIIYPQSLEEYLGFCKNRSVFTEEELINFYNKSKYRTIVKLLYFFGFKNKVVLNDLYKLKIVPEGNGPRLNTMISRQQFEQILNLGVENENNYFN